MNPADGGRECHSSARESMNAFTNCGGCYAGYLPPHFKDSLARALFTAAVHIPVIYS